LLPLTEVHLISKTAKARIDRVPLTEVPESKDGEREADARFAAGAVGPPAEVLENVVRFDRPSVDSLAENRVVEVVDARCPAHVLDRDR